MVDQGGAVFKKKNMGAGYNIPISVSYARTDTTNPVFSAATNFFFSSPWASTGTNDQSARNTDTATATSAAAQGNLAQDARSQTQGSQSAPDSGGAGTITSFTIPPALIYTVAGGFVILLASIWLKNR